jgi:predicted nucleotidyltransferase
MQIDRIAHIADRLAEVDGVVGVALGGSRARGAHIEGSDVDLGVYYRAPLDVDQLSALAAHIAGRPVAVTDPGGWGPWVDGGAWLEVDGQQVDWIYRNVDRIGQVWADCQAGRYTVSFQVGHPLGFYSCAYAGELALSQVLADPTGELGGLRAQVQGYPDPLGVALVRGTWEAGFLLGALRKALVRGDTAWVAGSLFRAIGVLVHGVHGHARRWLVNEKGAVAAAALLPGAPPDFAKRVARLLGTVGTTVDEHRATLAAAQALTDEVRAAIDA